MIVRPERAEDAAAVRALLVAAFGGPREADLVERLHRDGDLILSLVAENDGRVGGYAAFPKLTVEDAGSIHSVGGLAPVAVAPDWRRRGIGGALIREGHRLLAKQGHSLSFVLGDPAYYTRFGYDLTAAAGFECRYGGPNFMALRLNESAPKGGRLRYPEAFDHLG